MQLFAILSLATLAAAVASPNPKFEHGILSAEQPPAEVEARPVFRAIHLLRRDNSTTLTTTSTVSTTVIETTSKTTIVTTKEEESTKTVRPTTKTTQIVVTVTNDQGEESVVTSNTLVVVTQTAVATDKEDEKPSKTEEISVGLATSGAEMNLPGMGVWMGAGAMLWGALMG